MSRDKNATTLIEPQSALAASPSPVVRTAIAESIESAADADADDFIGQEVCGYTIKRKLAEGGMGVVYEGVHAKIGRTGAIKVLKPEFCRSEEVVERFYQEARAVNSIRHENIVDVYDFGRDAAGRVFFVMEYLEGELLTARIRRGALPWSEAYPILEQTLRALKAAHDQHFVHRDLKPDNIWLKRSEGSAQVKLLDFGIAKLVGAEGPKERLTRTGLMIGTPHYMSPEQINGSRDVDHRTDIYALGVIAYEMFAGVLPFVGDSLQAIMSGHLFKPPPRLMDLPAKLGLPDGIAVVVDRMLAKQADDRYANASDLLSDLQDLDRRQPPSHAGQAMRDLPTRVAALDASPSDAPRRPTGRARAAAGAILLAGLAGAGVAVWRPWSKPTPESHGPTTQTPTQTPPRETGPDYAAIRAQAQAVLRASLREAEPDVRVQGSDALAKVQDHPSEPALTDLTEHDPDGEVRGHTAAALGALGAASTATMLAKLETSAPPPLKVWYASALARLGDKGAVARLLGYAHDRDLAVSFSAGLVLADLSPAGDRKATAALKALLGREAELREKDPFAGVTLAIKLAGLRDVGARDQLYSLLDNANESVRLAAAEGLARLGHDAGKKVLQDVLASPSSPNHLIAAVAQIPLGEYGGVDVMTKALDDKSPEKRRLAAIGLGEIADRDKLARLVALAGDRDWTVRLAAARAIVEIVGLDPLVLARAAVDWTKSALDSQDLAVRRAAAGVLADIPAREAIPLLAVAIADADPAVRREAARSAGKMKSAAAAAKVAYAVKWETDAAAKEQQVRALGEIGTVGAPASHDTLAQISEEPGRVGLIAAGALIAVGDAAGNAKLEVARGAPQPEIRQAAMEAATLANNPIVVPTLKLGVLDHVFTVRFFAALGLSLFKIEPAAAVPVLTDALASKDDGIVGRALAALVRFGEKVGSAAQTAAKLIDATDPQRRLSALPIVRALQPTEAAPLLRRLVVDPDLEVRRAGVDAIEELQGRDQQQALRLYKSLVRDADPLVRSKVSARLSLLIPPLVPAGFTPRPEPATSPAVDQAVDRIQTALAETRTAANRVKVETDRTEALLGDLAKITAGATTDEATTEHVNQLKTDLDGAPARLEAAAARVETAAQVAADAAGATPSPEAARLVADAGTVAQRARDSVIALRGRTVAASKSALAFVTAWTGDAQLDIAAAVAKIEAGDFPGARRLLDRAARQLRKSGSRPPALDSTYGLLFERMADEAEAPADKRARFKEAADAYGRVVKTGGGRPAEEAKAHLEKIKKDLDALGLP